MKSKTFSALSQSKNFEVVSELGEGSFGSVYLVEDEKGKKYALKKARVDPFNFEESERQIQVMKRLSHQNLVKIYDYQVEKEKETVEILMEYCEEGDLFHYYLKRNKKLTVREILKIFKQLVQAFISMNVKGIFHRDLKPENVFITKGLVIKIGDFGCARSISSYDVTKVRDFTMERGTPMYASPEQLMDEKYSAKCDVWSSGVLLYFIYFGYHPFMGDTLEKIKQMTEHKEIQIPQDTDPTIAKILQLTLIFRDEERASWRELWLSRLFAEKIEDVESYVKYLLKLSYMGKEFTKMFWLTKKSIKINNKRDEVFIYFLVKFQYTMVRQVKDILRKSRRFQYLFEPGAYALYKPSEELCQEMKRDLTSRETFYTSVKEKLHSKEARMEVKEKETYRVSAYCDLDYTLKYGYQILIEIKEQLVAMGKEETDFRVWLFLAKWINFERWFGYENEPSMAKVLGEMQSITDPVRFILDELQRYEEGDVV